MSSTPERKRLPEDLPPSLVGIDKNGESEPTHFGRVRYLLSEWRGRPVTGGTKRNYGG